MWPKTPKEAFVRIGSPIVFSPAVVIALRSTRPPLFVTAREAAYSAAVTTARRTANADLDAAAGTASPSSMLQAAAHIAGELQNHRHHQTTADERTVRDEVINNI